MLTYRQWWEIFDRIAEMDPVAVESVATCIRGIGNAKVIEARREWEKTLMELIEPERVGELITVKPKRRKKPAGKEGA